MSLFLASSILLSTSCGFGPADDGRARPIAIVAWDGADWEIVDRLLERDALPNLSRLIEGGSSGILHTFEPTLSPLVWTSIATGKEPPEHGILDFLTVSEDTGHIVPTTSSKRRVKAMWNILSDRGLRAGIVGWLVTYPAERIEGYMVSDRVSILSFAQSKVTPVIPAEGKTYPPGLHGEIQAMVLRPEEVSDEAVSERFALRSLPDPETLRYLKGTLAQTETYRRIALQLLEQHDVDLFAVYFEGIDAISHLFIRFTRPLLPGTSEEDFRRYGHLTDQIYIYMDEILGEIIERLTPETTLFVISDHGFRTGEDRIPFEDSVMKDQYASDWHRDNGILVAHGPGIRRGHTVENASVVDILPTILSHFELPVGSDMPGEDLQDIREPAHRPRTIEPVGTHDESGWRARARQDARVLSEDEEQLKEKLRALGYIGAGEAAAHSNEHTNLAGYYVHRGEYERAIRTARLALESNPVNANAWKNLGESYIRMGDFEAASDALERVAAIRTDAVEVRRTLAGLYEQTGRHDKAIAILTPLLGKYPEDPRIPARLGTLHARAREYETACSYYERALSLYQNQPRVRYELLAAYAMMGRSDRAMRLLTDWNDAEGDISLPLELGKVFFKLGDDARAMRAYELAIDRQPGNAEAHFYQGLLFTRQGLTDRAVGKFEEAVALRPDYTEARLNLAVASLKGGRVEEAIKTLEAIVADEPEYAPAYTYLGKIHIMREEYDEARRFLDRAIEINPRAPVARSLLAEIPDPPRESSPSSRP
jgi:predicted AlkP superfamily phosphohydrolase/phosphomutase/Flp pilus assembly protein TadD